MGWGGNGGELLAPLGPVCPLGVWGWCHQQPAHTQSHSGGAWGTGGVPALGGWHTGTPPSSPQSPVPSTPCFQQEGSCCHLLAALSPAKRRWGHQGWGHEVRDAGMVAQQWPRDGTGMGGGPGQSCPTPDPPTSPRYPTDTHRHPGLYPPVMVATSRRGTGSAWGRAASGEAGPGERQRAGGRWPGGVSCGTAVSSLAGVTWGSRLPWGDALSSLAPRRGAGRRQSPCSGWYLGRRRC